MMSSRLLALTFLAWGRSNDSAPKSDEAVGITDFEDSRDSNVVLLQLRGDYTSNTTLHGACPSTIEGLSQQYNDIFKPSGNRNAASFLWFSYINRCAAEVDQQAFETMARGFCPISGSPISGENSAKVRLDKIGGGEVTGLFYFCCDPCICDMMDIVKVDTYTVKIKGAEKTYDVLVHGDPCKNEEKLNAPFTDPFSGKTASLKSSAPAVECSGTGGNKKLNGATFSLHGYPIIGLLHPGSEAMVDGTSSESVETCKAREKQGYNSGMGVIFRKVAEATPLTT